MWGGLAQSMNERQQQVDLEIAMNRGTERTWKGSGRRAGSEVWGGASAVYPDRLD